MNPLETKSEFEDQDLYSLRMAFADKAQNLASVNRSMALVLGEMFAKKVRYGVSYDPALENYLSIIEAAIETKS